MSADVVNALVWIVALAAILAALRQLGTRGSRVGPGAAGAIYEMLNEDKRKAIEIVVEQRTGEADPERPEGNLPDLETPGTPRTRP